MAGGWTRDGAVQDQIDDTVKDAVLAARARPVTGGGAPREEGRSGDRDEDDESSDEAGIAVGVPPPGGQGLLPSHASSLREPAGAVNRRLPSARGRVRMAVQ